MLSLPSALDDKHKRVRDVNTDIMATATFEPIEGLTPKSSPTYGYIWADSLFGYAKDEFMVDIYNNCKEIDNCTDTAKKAGQLLLLREKVVGSKKPWVEGIMDFIEFELRLLFCKGPRMDMNHNDKDSHAIAILHSAYLHGAFRGLCRTAGGAEWIGQLGEFCAAAVHQGFKWVRTSGGVDDWELPTLGESWCKGAALWGLVSMYVAVDIAGADPGNDAALERMHLVIGAHQFAGSNWLKYRGAHPHVWWNKAIRGSAPNEQSIRMFGERLGWPEEMTDVLSRSAKHINSWTNPPFEPVHLPRMRNLLIWDHTPRLKSRLMHVADEMAQLTDNVTDSEAEEILSRCGQWFACHTAQWRGRGDRNDRVLEVSGLGAALGVLRESRAHISDEFRDRAIPWTTDRLGHLSEEIQDLFLGIVLRSIEVRGRVPGAVEGYGTSGVGYTRFVDGWWHVATWAALTSHPTGGREVPANMRDLVVRFFNVWTKKRRIVGKDISAGPDDDGACPICVGSSIFEGFVDNRPSAGVWQLTTWGTLLYHNLGLGSPEDTDLGCV